MKRRILFLTFFVLFAMKLYARDAHFFIGTYNTPALPGIYTASLDTETGALSPVHPVCPPATAENPSFLALSPDGKRLFACLERKEGGVAAFRVGEDGALTPLNEQPAKGSATCHVSTTGREVFAANYGSGSFVWFKAPDGLESFSGQIQLEAGGPNLKRQAHSHAHSIYPVAGGKFVYGCDLGGDAIECYRFDKECGGLISIGRVRTPAGAGPRHLAFSPDERFVYCCNELDSTVCVFSRDLETGRLAALQTVPMLPENLSVAEFGGAEIELHPNGKWLYASTRDTALRGRDKIAVFKVGGDGTLRRIEAADATLRMPRGFAIDPTGRWLVVASQCDHRIAVLSIDPVTGTLKPAESSAEVHGPVCILFAH